MAKIVRIKNTAVNDSDETTGFEERLKQLPEDEQEMLKGLGVDSFEKFDDFIRMMGFFFSRFDKRDTNDYTIAQVLKEKGDRIKYEYDFGDSWEHDLWLKGIREYASEETRRLVVVKGKGACPPEDCGGVWGYAELLGLWQKKRKSAEEKERLEWFLMNKYFDPEEFDSKYAQKSFDELWEIAME